MVSTEIAVFAERVRRALAHLTVEQVAELTDGLEANIAASVADGAAIPDVEAYVAELLSAAGLAVPTASGGKAKKAIEFVNVAKDAMRGLAPMWWLVRALALTLLIGIFTSANPAWGAGRVMVRVGDNLILGWFVLALAVVGSVWAGRMEKRLPTLIRVVPGLVVVALTLTAVGNEFDFAAMMDRPQRLACFNQGFDSMGRRPFPTEPYPDFVGMSFYDADKAIMEWGNGMAMFTLVRGMEVAMSPRAKIVQAESAYINMSGGCPIIEIQVEIAEVAEVVDGSTSPSTTLDVESVTTIAPTATDVVEPGSVVPSTLVPGAVTATTVDG